VSLKGQLVEVCRGRKIAVGTVGRCTWHGRTKFGMRVQVEFDDGGAKNQVFMDARNVRRLRGQPVQQGLFGAVQDPDDVGDIPF
jgi:hypothetical protein